MEQLKLSINLNDKLYEGILAGLSSDIGNTHYLAIANVDEFGVKDIGMILSEKLGKPVESGKEVFTFGPPERLIESRRYKKNGFDVTSEIFDLSRREEYETEYGVQGLYADVRLWGISEQDKKHILLKMTEYSLPEIVPDVLKDFEDWF